MDFLTTALFYGVMGVAVSAAVALRRPNGAQRWQLLPTLGAVFFWPVFIPFLLERGDHGASAPFDDTPERERAERPADAIERAIGQVEMELESALRSLDGWAESALEGAEEKLGELRAAWHHQADRIRELDRLLAEPGFHAAPLAVARDTDPDASMDGGRVAEAERARLENLQRLKDVRRQLHRDLMGTLAWVRELVTMIHLARYTGAPASRAHELVSQMAAAVEGLREVSEWKCEVEV